MYNFVNQTLKKEAKNLVSKGWTPMKGKISGNSIEFEEDCSSYLYYGNAVGRDSDLGELIKMFEENLIN